MHSRQMPYVLSKPPHVEDSTGTRIRALASRDQPCGSQVGTRYPARSSPPEPGPTDSKVSPCS